MKPKKNNSITTTNNISALNETTLLNWIETKQRHLHQSQFRTQGESHIIFQSIKHRVLWTQRMYQYRHYRSAMWKYLITFGNHKLHIKEAAQCVAITLFRILLLALLIMLWCSILQLLALTTPYNMSEPQSKAQSNCLLSTFTFQVHIRNVLKGSFLRSQCAGWDISSAGLWLVLGAGVLPEGCSALIYSSLQPVK